MSLYLGSQKILGIGVGTTSGSIGEGIITINQGEEEKGSFSVNQNENLTINLDKINNIVLEKVSDDNKSLILNSVDADSTLSSTSTNPVQNKVLYPSLNGFIPNGTQFVINPNGTGDFTSLSSAINYLTDKWSNGRIVLFIPANTTIQESESINIGERFRRIYGIPCVVIKGENNNTSVIEFTKDYSSTNSQTIYCYSIPMMVFERVKIKASTFQPSTRMWGINAWSCSMVVIDSCNFENVSNAITSCSGSQIHLTGTINITNSRTNGLVAQLAGRISAENAVVINFNNITSSAVAISGGSFIQLSSPNFTYTNVGSKCNVTPNTVTSNGIVLGLTV